MDEGIEIRGLEQTAQMLRDAPRAIVVAGFAKALKAGADVIAAELLPRTPERSEGDRDESQPHLVDSLVIEVRVDPDAGGGQARIGFGDMGYVANFLEYGHRMVGHKPTKKELGFVNPKPFMRPAAAAASEEAPDAFADSLADSVRGEYS